MCVLDVGFGWFLASSDLSCSSNIANALKSERYVSPLDFPLVMVCLLGMISIPFRVPHESYWSHFFALLS